MSSRIYRLTEIHQRIDEHMRQERARSTPDLTKILRLMRQKLRTRRLLLRQIAAPQAA
jgi:hypothetical protein